MTCEDVSSMLFIAGMCVGAMLILAGRILAWMWDRKP